MCNGDGAVSWGQTPSSRPRSAAPRGERETRQSGEGGSVRSSEVYLVLELIAKEQGRDDASLRSWLTPGQPLPVEQALLFALQIARGMAHAAAAIPGFVHRDLKPENVLVGADRLPDAERLSQVAPNRLRVTDFGLASVLQTSEVSETSEVSDEPGRTQLTHGIVGTPLYMAPEQWQGQPVTVAADVYALGCILYEMLAGQRAASGHSIPALQRAHCEGSLRPLPPDLPATACPEHRRRVCALLTRCLAVDPAARYADWDAVGAGLASALETIAGHPVPPPAPAAALTRAERVAAGWSYSAMGASYMDIGKAEVAAGYFERARAAGAAEGERRLEAAGLTHLGLAYARLGDARRAIGYYEQALVIAREIGDRRGEGAALGNLGLAYADLGDAVPSSMARAIGYYEQALVIDREIGDRRGEGAALGNLGVAYKNLGDARRAIGYYEQQLVITREIGDRRGEGNDLGNLGNAYSNLGDHQQAVGYYERQLEIVREIGDLSGLAINSFNLADEYRLLGDTARALPLAQQAAQLFTQIGHAQYAQRAQGLIAQLQGGAPTTGPSSAHILQQFTPVIQAVVAAAHGHPQARAMVEEAFDAMTRGNWRIVEPIQRIWQGERDESTLTAGIDSNSALIVREILRQLEH